MSEEFGLIINNEHSLDENVHIDWNKDELLKYVRSITEKYNGRVYTDDDITDARTDRAELNALKNTISDGRIRVKKAVMAPYDRFEADVAEVTNLIIEAVKPIDEAIKTHDENQKADKKKQLVAYFDSIIGDLAESPILPSAVCSMMIWPIPVSAMLPLKLCLNTLMTTSTRTASKFSLH